MILTEPRISQADKKKADSYIKLIALLISHESIFLGETPKFIIKEMDLLQTLELIACIYEKESREHGIEIIIPKKRCIVQADSHYLKEIIQQIFKKLLPRVSKIECRFSHSAKILTIEWKSDIAFVLKQEELGKCLDSPDSDEGREIAFQLGLRLLQLHGTPVTIANNKIRLAFK